MKLAGADCWGETTDFKSKYFCRPAPLSACGKRSYERDDVVRLGIWLLRLGSSLRWRWRFRAGFWTTLTLS